MATQPYINQADALPSYRIFDALDEKVTYEFVPHTADIKVAIKAPSLSALYSDATTILRTLLVGDSAVREQVTQRLSVNGDDPSELLLRFLRELLYRFDTERFVPARLQELDVQHTHLITSVCGERFDAKRHETQPEVKAVTRHQLAVERADAGWRAEVVFDL